MEKEILYIWLSKIKGIGPVLANKLLDYFRKIEGVYEATYEELIKVDGIGPKSAMAICENKDLSKSRDIYEKCKRLNISIVIREAIDFPYKLMEFNKAPIILYVKGKLRFYEEAVAIVGSRRCTGYGKSITVELANALCNRSIPIISGMAKGIDGYAHTVALNNNNYTIAVLGTGIDKCYPSEHLPLMNKIIESGTVISQFEPGVKDNKNNFLKRNELIAMLSSKVVVVEANKESGALYTAKCGMKFSRQVYAVPGNINNKCSEGTNILINEGVKIYLSTASIIGKEVKVQEEGKLNEIELQVLSLVEKRSLSIDAIKSILGLDYGNVEELLFEMESKGEIRQIGGGYSKS